MSDYFLGSGSPGLCFGVRHFITCAGHAAGKPFLISSMMIIDDVKKITAKMEAQHECCATI